MVKQLNLLGEGQIIPTALHTEMERSYLEYAMSVIVGRALPDVRDGLKPVHRRILYAMYELGLTPDRPFRKCARVVGDVLGKYHPHGDQSVYDAMVRLIQDFSSRYPLLAGHGNFGSVDNDPPAAMRYTETRLAPIAYQSMLGEINEATVDFTSNFDNSQQEPLVLPAQLPILLLNGCSGIAVGMATNIPPHNLGEVVDGLIALIDRPDLPDQKLWDLIPGPDFPTGGAIINTQGIQEAYLTGKGIIPVRGVAMIEQIKHNKKHSREKTAIIVTELPFQVNKAGWIEKVADLVNQGRISDIADIRDESDRQGIRVVIELKRDTDAEVVLEQLFNKTALQSNFGVIMLGLVQNKPCQLSLKELLQEFLQFREVTLTRQYNYQLEESQDRLHLLEGLLAALNNLDRVIEILRNAPDATTAKMTLQGELDISDPQANSILAMPLRRLTGLERQKLATEHQELQLKIAKLQKLLGERKELLKALKKELRSFKRQFADPRKTKILPLSPQKIQPKSDPKNKSNQETIEKQNIAKRSDQAVLKITEKGYIYWQNQEDLSDSLSWKKQSDLPLKQELIGDKQQLIAILDSGKAYPIATSDIPDQTKKKTFDRLLSDGATKDGNKPIDYFLMAENHLNSHLILLTLQGRLKRISGNELNNIGNRGLMLIKLKQGDRLSYSNFAQEGENIAIATNGGRVLRFLVGDGQIPVMGRSAQGNQGIKLRYGEKIVGCNSFTEKDNLLLVSELGYAQILPLKAIRQANLGQLGTQAFRFSHQGDNLLVMLKAPSQKQIILITSQGRKILFNLNELPVTNKDKQAKSLVKLKPKEKIRSVIAWSENLENS
jgi:DNA gyrase subunit A